MAILFAIILHKKEPSNTVCIKFSAWGSQTETALVKSLIKDFEQKNPDVKVEFLNIPQNYFQKLHLLFASNLAPDVIFINNYYAPKYVKAGLLLDFTPYVNKNLFFEKSIDSFTFDKKLYAIPRDISELVVYYNKDLFLKNNLPFPQKDWTIADFKEICKKLSKDTDKDGTNDVWGTGFETDVLFWLPFLLSNGASVFSEDASKLLITERNAIEALNEYSDMANKLNIAPKKSQSASLTMAQLFLQQKIAMHISGRWLVPKYREQANFDWDIARFPTGTNGSVMNIDASGYAVSKSTKHQREALRFVDFMSSKSAIDTLSQSGLIVPALKESANSESFLAPDKKPKNAKIFIETAENGISAPVNENYQVLVDNLNKTLEPVFLGKQSAEKALKNLRLN